MNNKAIIILVLATVAYVVGRPEPPVDEPLEGPRHYPELLPRVRDLLIYDNPPGAQSSSGAYGVPGGPGSFGGLSPGQMMKEIILADPELAPLLSTFDLTPSVEKRGPAAGGNGAVPGGSQNSGGFDGFQGRSSLNAGGYN